MALESNSETGPSEPGRERSQPGKDSSQHSRPVNLKEDVKEVLHKAVETSHEGVLAAARAKDAALDSLRSAKEHAVESLADGVQAAGVRAREAGSSLSDFVARHAIPLTVLAAGAGWLLLSMSHQRRLTIHYLGDGQYDDLVREGLWDDARVRVGQLGRRASSALSRTGQRATQRGHELQSELAARAVGLRDQAGEGLAHVGHEAGELGQRVYRGIERAGSRALDVSERSPLTRGLVALAAGALVTILLSPARRETRGGRTHEAAA
jgi:hypothetical protein